MIRGMTCPNIHDKLACKPFDSNLKLCLAIANFVLQASSKGSLELFTETIYTDEKLYVLKTFGIFINE